LGRPTSRVSVAVGCRVVLLSTDSLVLVLKRGEMGPMEYASKYANMNVNHSQLVEFRPMCC